MPQAIASGGPLKAWSHSKVVEFEKCPLRTYLLHVAKIPEPERTLAEGKTEHANDRGTRVHDAAEKYVRGKGKFPVEFRNFVCELEHLRECFKLGIVSLEGEWGMDRDWEIAPWNEAWLRLKLDALTFLSPQVAVVIDFKTGRRFGNEFKHAEQTQLYALVTALRFPAVELIHTELWYVDQPESDSLVQATYTREQALRFRESWTSRGARVTNTTEWKANPNKVSCQYCRYGPGDGGQCSVGVRNASFGKKQKTISVLRSPKEQAEFDANLARTRAAFAQAMSAR